MFGQSNAFNVVIQLARSNRRSRFEKQANKMKDIVQNSKQLDANVKSTSNVNETAGNGGVVQMENMGIASQSISIDNMMIPQPTTQQNVDDEGEREDEDDSHHGHEGQTNMTI